MLPLLSTKEHPYHVYSKSMPTKQIIPRQDSSVSIIVFLLKDLKYKVSDKLPSATSPTSQMFYALK